MLQLNIRAAKSFMLSFWLLVLKEQSSEWPPKKVVTTLRANKAIEPFVCHVW